MPKLVKLYKKKLKHEFWQKNWEITHSSFKAYSESWTCEVLTTILRTKEFCRRFLWDSVAFTLVRKLNIFAKLQLSIIPAASCCNGISLAPFTGCWGFKPCQRQGGCVSVLNCQKEKLQCRYKLYGHPTKEMPKLYLAEIMH